MADIITAVKDNHDFCVAVLAAFLTFISILCAADLKNQRVLKWLLSRV